MNFVNIYSLHQGMLLQPEGPVRHAWLINTMWKIPLAVALKFAHFQEALKPISQFQR